MIETLGTYAELHHPPRDVERWLLQDGSPWTVTSNLSTGSLSASLSGTGTLLGRVKISQNRDAEDSAAAYVVQAEGNVLTLLHGHRAKHLTLRAADLPAALDAYHRELTAAVPIGPTEPDEHRLIRVDASATWRRSDTDATRALAQARAVLTSQRSGRKMLVAYGVEGVTLVRTKRHTDRVYDKSAETIAAAKRARVDPPNLGAGRLIRLENQLRSKTARSHYGDNLTYLADTGADMARRALVLAADGFAAQGDTGTPSELAARLIAQGATASEAARLMGPALLLAEGGVPALINLGISQSYAYAVRARIRQLAGTEPDDADLASEHDQDIRDTLWDVDDAEYAEEDS